MTSDAVTSEHRTSSGAKVAIVLVVIAAVLAGAFYGADAYLHARVEREAASQIQGQLGTPTTPEVTIDGWPFLTQVAAQSLHSVHLVADDVGETTNASLPIAHVDMTLSDVSTDDFWKSMNVAHAEGTATVDYTALQQVAGIPLTYTGNGRFAVTQSTSIGGTELAVKVTGGLALDVPDQTVTVSDPMIELVGITLPDAVSKALVNAVVKPVSLNGLPFGLTVSAIDPEDDGLHAHVAGDNIPFTR